MKALYMGLAGTVVIAVAAWLVLNELGLSSAEVHSGENVRLE